MRFQQITQPSLRPHLEILEDRTLMSTCRVTRLSDMGAGMGLRGDLRYCINKVNAEPGADIILIHRTGTINLQSALPSLASDIDIQGPGADLLTVRRDTSVGNSYRIFRILAGSTVQISHLTISDGRQFSSNGGGIHNAGTLTILGCTVGRNSVQANVYAFGAGIYNSGDLTVIDSTIKGNRNAGGMAIGGGIYNKGAAAIYNSTISDNDASLSFDDVGFGSGLSNDGVMIVLNSTIAFNRSEWGFGGGVWAGAGLTVISHSTIAGNSAYEEGGGIHAVPASSLFLRNSIVAGNADTSEASSSDVVGNISASSYNLIGNTQGGSGFDPNTDLLNVDPLLGSLAANGGPTLTMALLPGSPAIDAGDNADAPEFDQRGPGFPRIVNGTIDIGAFEVQATGAPSPHGRASVLALATSDALKGRDITAQGNALGNEAIFASALKGRDHRTAEYGVSIAPLQALVHRATFQPRALPWPDLFRPVGAEGDLEIFT